MHDISEREEMGVMGSWRVISPLLLLYAEPKQSSTCLPPTSFVFLSSVADGFRIRHKSR